MSVYVGIDVHRKRSQVAVVAEDGQVQLNKNVVNGSEPMLRLTCRMDRRHRSCRGSIRSAPHASQQPGEQAAAGYVHSPAHVPLTHERA